MNITRMLIHIALLFKNILNQNTMNKNMNQECKQTLVINLRYKARFECSVNRLSDDICLLCFVRSWGEGCI